MAELIAMRERIKTIKTIKKITHAMRLISMSTHSRLKNNEDPLKSYQKTVESLFYKLKHAYPNWHNPVLMPRKSHHHKDLVILIGSQKGLCGTFNSLLFRSFTSIIAQYNTEHVELIAVGKRAADFLKGQNIAPITDVYEKFTINTLPKILKKLTEKIMFTHPTFHSVTVVSNVLKTFFFQSPKATRIIPSSKDTLEDENVELPEDYIWEQPPQEILDGLATLLIQSSLQHLLFQSLLSEQAARFLSMDGATRNAESLLEKAQITYNKLRQAKITKELTELSASHQEI